MLFLSSVEIHRLPCINMTDAECFPSSGWTVIVLLRPSVSILIVCIDSAARAISFFRLRFKQVLRYEEKDFRDAQERAVKGIRCCRSLSAKRTLYGITEK